MRHARGMTIGGVVVLAACSSSPNAAPPSSTPFVDAVVASSTAFFGTVVALGARTTDAVPASAVTTVVRLDSLITGDSTVSLDAGDSMTVVVRDTNALRVGGQYGFLAYGLVLDTGVVVQEVWHEDAGTPAQRAAFLDEYQKAVPLALDQQTAKHLPEVDLVAAGTIARIDTSAVPDSIRRRTQSESSPDWQVAELRAMRVLRGDTTLVNRPVRVLFPGSRHITYSLIPRPRAGDSAVYLIHGTGRFPRGLFNGIDSARAFVLFHDLDVRALSDTGRIATLLRTKGTP